MITNERNIHVVGRTANGTGTGLLSWIIVEGLAPHTSLAALSHVQPDARQPAIVSWRAAAGAATHREDTGNPSENRVNAHVYIFIRYVTSDVARVHPHSMLYARLEVIRSRTSASSSATARASLSSCNTTVARSK